MAGFQLRTLVGLEALETVTVLLQRIRRGHPTAGLWEAADFQWWWRAPRSTDSHPQHFWFDDDGRPEAAVIATAWRDQLGLDAIFLPETPSVLVAEPVAIALARAPEAPSGRIAVEVDPDDGVLRGVLESHGFRPEGDGVAEAWLRAGDRPPVARLAPGYRLTDRTDPAGRPHHMAGRGGPELEARLRQTSLYRPELDLAVLDDRGDPAAYGLFWFDPVTATGLVEPMRTEDAHQRRGLARHVLTVGVDRLSAAGATRVKICFEPDNAAAKGLYLDVGFQPERLTVVYAATGTVSPSAGAAPTR